MRHNISREGYGVRLRPVQLSDAKFIVHLRNSPHAIGKIGDSAATIESQGSWLEKYFSRELDYYFIIESLSGNPLGTYGIYDFMNNSKSAEGGRWIIQQNIPAAIPSIIIALDIAFNIICLEEVRGTVVETNTKVLSLDCNIGFLKTGIVQAEKIINAKPVNIVHLKMFRSEWETNRKKLVPLAECAAKILEKI